ncbi:hypothetical protein ACFPRL_16250 [Pseudoclavibacter helvolus]
MRRRKPWVFARRRLFGWKVRFDMRTPEDTTRSADAVRIFTSALPKGTTALTYVTCGRQSTGARGPALCSGHRPPTSRHAESFKSDWRASRSGVG